MIRLLFGFLMIYGSVGTLEVDPYAPLLPSVLWAIVGLSITAWPVLDGTFDRLEKENK
tara:strand:+ start:717 stop:890 length:174 start_codon:yes stop_codon:yes gene_type:complete